MSSERIDYTGEGLAEADLLPSPFEQASVWLQEAQAFARESQALKEPSAIHVATVDESGLPDVRTVLMRFFDERGPGFVSSSISTKATELAVNDGIAATLTWVPMFRAIRFRGKAIRIDEAELAAYWEERPWGSRISAWASRQSEPVADRAVLEQAFAAHAERFPDTGEPGAVPVPEDWAGWRIDCSTVEFWGGRSNRLHDRFRFTRVGEGTLADASAWQVHRLAP